MQCRTLLATALTIGVIAAAMTVSVRAQPQSSRVLAKADIQVLGVRLGVCPETAVTPRDIGGVVWASLESLTPSENNPPVCPPTKTIELPLAADAEVRAVLRGPSLSTPIELKAKPNSPFHIPPLTIAGIHTLENIRLVSDGEVLLYGAPESVKIEVIDKLLVTQVTARALTSDEIREKGLVFDRSSFQAYNFTAAFAVADGKKITVDFPVVLPSTDTAGSANAGTVTLPSIGSVPQIRSLETIVPDTLKLQTQIPNLQVVGFTLKVPAVAGQNFVVPPIPGVIVIPGDIGFLNQQFSVMLMVSNVAPNGSNLVVTDLKATIVLPTGNDAVVGSNDDPLRLAQTATGTSQPAELVTQPGPDGKLGTGDDVLALAPGQTGSAEFLVEGRREGNHIVEMQLAGTLNGLPIGPVPVTGRAAGSVAVRNPTFTLTYTHPDLVNAGEAYTIDVTVTNTSGSPANLVSLGLFENNIAGATLVGEPSKQIDFIAPGDSASVSFDLVSRISGKITAGTIDSDGQVGGRFLLKTSVGELGVPLSPDSLVLPKEADSLPKPLRDASLGLLGKAWAVATAPSAALPKDVSPFSRKVVFDRAVEVAAAGLRLSLEEFLPASVSQLMMEFAGSDYARLAAFNTTPDDLDFARRNFNGFDELRRRSVRGDVFADAIGAVLGLEAASAGAAGFHEAFANRVSYRPRHISVLAMSTTGGSLPLTIVVRDAAGHATGGVDANGKVRKDVSFSDWIRLRNGTIDVIGQLAVVTTPAGDYTIDLIPDAKAPPAARYTLSIVLPGADGTLRHAVYENLSLAELPVFEPLAGEPNHLTLTLSASGGHTSRAANAVVTLPDPPPTVVSVIQQRDADVIGCAGTGPFRVGRVVAVLFSEEVTALSVQDKLRSDLLTNYTIAGNRVVGVALQPGGRIVFLALRDPVGPFVPSSITFNGIQDLRGHPIVGATVPIETTIQDDAGLLSGQVLHADGTPVQFASVRLLYKLVCQDAETTVTQTFGISSKSADAQGGFNWDFVLKGPFAVLSAVDAETDESRDVTFSVARNGQHVNANVVFLGRGTLTGRALAEDGVTPLKDTFIRVTSLTDQTQYGAQSDALGRFTIARLPAGNILIEAVSPTTQASVFVSEVIPSAGAIVTRDLILLGLQKPPSLELKTGTLTARVLRGDGVTPAAGVLAIAWYENNSQTGITCEGGGSECPIAKGISDASGTIVFGNIAAGRIRVSAIDQELFQEGQASTTLPADGSAQVTVLFGSGLATVKGVVLDASGAPVAGARVGGGLSLATTNEKGLFTLTDVPVGRREIVAVSDAQLTKGSATVDIVRAGEEVNATIVLAAVGSIAGTVYAAGGAAPLGGIAVYVLGTCDGKVCVTGQAATDASGHYRVDGVPVGSYKVSAFAADFTDGNVAPISVGYHKQIVRGDVTFRGGGGRVHGVVYDEDGQTRLKATVSISGDQAVVASGKVGVGFQFVQNYRIVDTDPKTGEFSFANVLVGPFTVRAAGQFSPDPVTVDRAIPQPNATIDLSLRLQSKSIVKGTLFESDNVTPVTNRQVAIKYKSDGVKVFCTETSSGESDCVSTPQGIQELTVVTNDAGEFSFPSVNAGAFTLTADDAATGRIGEARGTARAGETALVDFRLTGRAAITVQVYAANRDAGGNPVPLNGATVGITQIASTRKQVTGLTGPDGRVRFAGADAFAEGQFVVSAAKSGFVGRMDGRIDHDGGDVAVTVFLNDSVGNVSGQIFRGDGITAVANSELVILSSGQVVAFALTNSEGGYAVSSLPLGPVRIEAFDPTTGQRGAGEATISLNGQDVSVNVRLDELAMVRGTVLQSGTLAPLKAWTVSLFQTSTSGRGLPTLITSTGVDGAFSFPGASVGAFTLLAKGRDVNGQGNAAGVVTRAGQAIDVPIVVTIDHAASGRIAGAVVNVDGSPGANAVVSLFLGSSGPSGTTTALDDGTFVFDGVPLGRFTVTAKSQVGSNAGSGLGDVVFDGSTANVVVTLGGVSRVTGTIYRPGPSGTRVPAPNVQIQIVTTPSQACSPACTTFADANGRFSFIDLPANAFTVSATDPITLLRGSAGGALSAGTTTDVDVVLEVSGSVAGRALSSAGIPKAGLVAQLVVQLAVQQRRLFAVTDGDGRFAFLAVAPATYALDLTDPIGSGVASRQVVVNGVEDLGDIVLDDAAPAVTTTSPARGAVSVPLNQSIKVTFSEAVDIGSVGGSTLVLSGPNGSVTSVVTLSLDQKVATVQPLTALAEQTKYSVRITGVKDLVGKTLTTPYVLNFTTVDLTPPSVVELSPEAGTHGTPIYSTVRVKFSEPIDPSAFAGQPIVLQQGSTAVAGRVEYLFGNTVLVFTPNLPLAEDSIYTVDMAAVVDIAGNHQAPPLHFSFSTTDRTPPQVIALQAIGGSTVIENLQKQVRADVGAASDVAFVDFFVNGAFAATARTVPYTLVLQATSSYGKPGEVIHIAASATDTSGNRGPLSASTSVTVLADQAPLAVITSPAQGLQARNGDHVGVVVHATDDVGVTQVSFKAHTGKTTDAAVRAVNPSAGDRTEAFGFDIPVDAAPGSSIVVEASATDTANKSTAAQAVSVAVLDGVKPAVQITGASSGGRVRPGQEVTVVLAASDLGGIAKLGFTASGAASFNDVRAIDTVQNSVATSFTFTVMPTATSNDRVFLDGFAEDRAGNRSDAARIVLAMADNVPPTVTIRTETGLLEMVPGRSITVIADATDETGVTRVTLAGTGAFALTDVKSISPPATPASAAFSVNVPATVAPGQTLTLRAQAFDVSNNVSTPAELTLVARSLSDVTLPGSVIVVAGESQVVSIGVPAPAPSTGLVVALTSSNPLIAAVPAAVQFAAGENTKTFTVSGVSGGTAAVNASIDGVQRASMTATVRGGVVRGHVRSGGQPVSGASVTIEGSASPVTTGTVADGSYFVEGVTGAAVSVHARNAEGTLLGSSSGNFNRPGGFVVVDVSLIAGSTVRGTVRRADGTLAGGSVKVDLFLPNSPLPAATTFTAQDSSYHFDFVLIGSYVLNASDVEGNRGRATVEVGSGGQDLAVPIAYLGRGTVTGIVRDAAGHALPNIPVTFSSTSIFGQASPVATDTDATGAFQFINVFVGNFSVDAHDPVTSTGGRASGAIASDRQTVDIEVRLTATATLVGTIYKADEHTPVLAGVAVTLNGGRSTITDAQGGYQFEFVPLGSFTLTVSDASSRARGLATGSLTVNGETKTVNVNLAGQGTLIVTVRDSSGIVVQGALVHASSSSGSIGDSLAGTTAADGTVVLEHFLAGSFTVTASLGSSGGTASGSFATDEAKSVTITFAPPAPVGSITGTVFRSNGQSPAPAGRVVLAGRGQVALTENGGFRFDQVPLGLYTLQAYDANNVLRATAVNLALQANGQLVTQNLTFVAVGSVTGAVLYPGGSAAAGLSVRVQTSSPTFGGTVFPVTNAGGVYRADNIAVGDILASTQDVGLGFIGENAGKLVDDGQELVLDIVLGRDNVAPSVQFTSPGVGSTVVPGQSVNVGVHATDNVGVVEVTVTTTGPLSTSQTRTTAPTTSFDGSFALAVPQGTLPGVLTISAVARDGNGQVSAPVTRDVTVLDNGAPVVAITSPSATDEIDPRSPLHVAVQASDPGGVARVAFTASGSAIASETRDLPAAQISTTQLFDVSFQTLPATGGSLTLAADARDVSGNQSSATLVTVRVRDVIAPTVVGVTPLDGSIGIDPQSPILVSFSEPLDRATLTTANLVLRRGSTSVAVVVAPAGDDRSATITPSSSLALNTVYTLVAGTGLADRSGNTLATETTSTFRTASPDTTPPQVTSVTPVAGATGVSLTTAIDVVFNEPVDAATITAQTFRVTANGAAVVGTRTLRNNNSAVRFTPSQPFQTDTTVVFEVTGDVTDAFSNRLVDPGGNPLTTPLTFTFLTGAFDISSPGNEVVENSDIVLEARASAGLGVVTVQFTVNGQALPPASAPAFQVAFKVPSLASVQTLTIAASGLDGSGKVIAQVTRVVNVTFGLSVTPRLTGVQPGTSILLTYSVSSPVEAPLVVTLTPADASALSAPVTVTIPTGERSISAVVTGVAEKSTTIVATSARGRADAIVAVSRPTSQQQVSGLAQSVGTLVLPSPSLGSIAVAPSKTHTLGLTLLSQAIGVPTIVSLSSSDPTTASVPASLVIPAGDRVASVPVTTGSGGLAVITLRGGGIVRQLTIIIGTPGAAQLPPVVAPVVGALVLPPLGLGTAFAGRATTQTIRLLMYPQGAPAARTVTVSTSNAAIISAPAAITVGAGEKFVDVPITSGNSDGEATLTLRDGTLVRSLSILTGTVPANRVPAAITQPLGVAVLPRAPIARVAVPLNRQPSVGVQVPGAPLPADTPVKVSSSNPSVVSAQGDGLIRQGERTARIDLLTGAQSGVAVLTLEFAGRKEEMVVVVGTVSPNQIPVVVAPVVGVFVN